MAKILSIRVHYTWIFVFALVTAIVTTQFSESYPLLLRILMGVIVSLVFLAVVAIRELILSAAAFHREIPVKRITLFAFGGVYQENMDGIVSIRLPLLYLARFLSNLVIAIIFYGLYATFINAGNVIMSILTQWLVYIFFLLFLLNLFPVFPLDGGEILRFVLWRSTGNYHKATRTASLLGWATGLFLIFASVLIFIITQLWIISLVIILFGWIIQIAAGNVLRQAKTHSVLQYIRAEDIMTREYSAISREINIRQLIRQHILINGRHYMMVVDDGKLCGIVTLNQIKAVSAKRWNNTTAGDIMTPSAQIKTAQPQQTADTLYNEMYRQNLDYLPVQLDDKIVGVVTRQALIDVVKVRSEFGI